MSKFNYLKANRAYNELYYQYPKVFIEGEHYKKLSEGAKIAYMLLKARSESAVLKNQIDADGNIYFEFTGKELAQMMNCSPRRVTTLKKELEDFGLLLQIQMGFNKQTGKNEKNRLYLAELQVTDKDIYSMQKRENDDQTIDNTGVVNFAKRSIDTSTTENTNSTGVAKFATRSDITKSVDKSGLANFAKELDNNKPDTKNIDTTLDTEKSAKFQTQLLATFHLGNEHTFLSERSLEFIAMYSKTIQQAHNLVGIILRAKKKAEKDEGQHLIADEWQEELDLQVIKLVRKLQTDHTIQQPENYWFKSFYILFSNCIRELVAWQSKSTNSD